MMSFWRFCDPSSPASNPIPSSRWRIWRSDINSPCSTSSRSGCGRVRSGVFPHPRRARKIAKTENLKQTTPCRDGIEVDVCGFKNHAPVVFPTATPKLCLRTDSIHHHGFQAPVPGATSRPATLGMRTGTSHHLRRTGRQRPEARQRPGRRASQQRHLPRATFTSNARSAQSLHPGLRGWRELCRRRCHHGTYRKNFRARA